MDIFNTFAVDSDLEENGVWVKLDSETSIKIARSGNKKFTEKSKKIVEKKRSEYRGKKSFNAQDLSDEDVTDLVASTVLLDWEGLKYQGEILAYSLENAKKVLAHKDFFAIVFSLSNEMETFKIQKVEELKEELKK